MTKLKQNIRRLCGLLIMACGLSVFLAAQAASFKVSNIIVHGNQRTSTGTVLSYVSLHPGQQYTDAAGDSMIKALFKSGLFSDVHLSRMNHTLIIDVKERPTIGYLDVSGNKAIKTKVLFKVLKSQGLVEGGVYNPTKLKQVTLGLQNQYNVMGHSLAVVTTQVKPAAHNQVKLYIKVNEGKIAKVGGITLSGNHHFKPHELKDVFKLETPGILTFFNHRDRFSRSQLDQDLQSLHNFYLDHGYMRFNVVSKKVTFNALHTKAYIHIVVSEGPVYTIKGYRLSDATGRYKSQIKKMITVHSGETFSRKKVLKINHKIANFLADRGYAFPTISPIPQLDDKHHTVFLTFQVTTGHRIYVHHINFIGNDRTADRAIRQQLRQMENSIYSRKKIKESTRRIKANMPYLTNISESLAPTPNAPDQVNVNYKMKEVSAGRASIQGGYSDVDGFIYGASINEPNFLGSGKSAGLGFTRNKYSSNYNLSYSNPFYTVDGISRSFNLFYTHTTPGDVNLESYSMDDVGTSVSYGIPVSEFNSLTLGGGYDYIDISGVDRTHISPAVVRFLDKYPPAYNQLHVTAGFTHQSLDRAIFPTSGSLQSLNLTVGPPLGDWSLGYYTATFNGKWFMPFGDSGFVFEPHTTLGYGGGFNGAPLPFFNNFYGGGLGTLPGFEPNSLGPKNPHDVSQAMGGNLEMFAGMNLFAPSVMHGKVRIGGTFNIGNVFDTNHINSTPKIEYENINFNNLRMSVGVLVSWWWPLGAPIDLSLAVPLNKKKNDQEAIFGFSMGGSL